MNIPCPVNYLCAVTELSILIVTRKHEIYVQIFSILVTLNPFMKSLTSSKASLNVLRASTSIKKIHFLQDSCVAAVSVPLAEPCFLSLLSRTITEDSISDELHVKAQKNICTIWSVSSYDDLLLCFCGEAVRTCEEVDQNLILHILDSLRCSSTYLYLFMLSHAL